ncbi:hypothetical protein V7S43_006958 [Phytophthora oleae]|uniref:DDE-1 domain-containing protein n=1 Tax=Phytophthora oleae TaxID=2107226 RepID=A0ABD3FR41_9STRA
MDNVHLKRKAFIEAKEKIAFRLTPKAILHQLFPTSVMVRTERGSPRKAVKLAFVPHGRRLAPS